jgi:hypothetical protein
MSVEVRVEPLIGKLPTVAWRWDAETDILAGSFKVATTGPGLTGTVELTNDEGAIAVLDVIGGVIHSLDVVVWPEVSVSTQLTPPVPTGDGRVVVPSRLSQPGIASLEMDAALSIATTADESVFHLRLGNRRPVEVVRIADHWLAEVDQKRRLAGFWLLAVPKFEGEQD